MADIDLITIAEYYTYQERSMPSPITDKETTFTQLITQASSFCETHCNRPFLTGGTVTAPVDINGDALTEYAVYASLSVIPFDLKTACCLLVTHFKFEADHFAISSTSDNNKSKNYNLSHYNVALNILNKGGYHYYEPLNRTQQRIYGYDPEDGR